VKLNKIEKLNGVLKLPGDKSISHRAAILAAIAGGVSYLRNYSPSADCTSTLKCVEMLGARIERQNEVIKITGCGSNGFTEPKVALDCGNSGTTMRLLAGVLAGQPLETILTGDESLSRRPMGRIVEPLKAMGAMISSTDGHAPLRIFGRRPLMPVKYRLPVASAQVKSAILLAGLFADGVTTVTEPVPTRDHTELMLPAFGAKITTRQYEDGKQISVTGGQLSPADIRIPSDISAAAFFLVAAACLPGSEIRIENVGLNPSRTAILEVLTLAGVDITVSKNRFEGGEPVGDILVKGGLDLNKSGKPIILSGNIIANLIDEAPILAIFGTQLSGGLEIRNAGELRHKESDRITAICNGLRQMGASIEEFEDGFRVGKSRLHGAQIDSHGDHRIAMAFSVAALFADGETVIVGAESAAVSFPDFYKRLAELSYPGPQFSLLNDVKSA
jgi:3-phosphoshikimate 1-carboxyvinyltransferase